MTTSEKKQEIIRILEEVLRLTEAGKLRWRDSPREDRYMTLGEAGGVQVERRVQFTDDGEELADYRVSLLNQDGLVVESMDSESELNGTRLEILYRLFLAARASARQSEVFLKGFKKYLETLERQ